MRYSDYVDYGKLDPLKKMALEKLSETFGAPKRLGIRVVPESPPPYSTSLNTISCLPSL